MDIKNPLEVEKELRKTTDGLGMRVDPRIFKSCVILNSLGHKTRQSCEGHPHRYSTYPWIDIYYNKKETPENYLKSSKNFYNTLFQDLKEFYNTKNIIYDQMITFEKFRGKVFLVRLSQLENSKCYKNKREEKIEKYLQEINEFCQFLSKKYNLNY
jgi:hypothetical protein